MYWVKQPRTRAPGWQTPNRPISTHVTALGNYTQLHLQLLQTLHNNYALIDCSAGYVYSFVQWSVAFVNQQLGISHLICSSVIACKLKLIISLSMDHVQYATHWHSSLPVLRHPRLHTSMHITIVSIPQKLLACQQKPPALSVWNSLSYNARSTELLNMFRSILIA